MGPFSTTSVPDWEMSRLRYLTVYGSIMIKTLEAQALWKKIWTHAKVFKMLGICCFERQVWSGKCLEVQVSPERFVNPVLSNQVHIPSLSSAHFLADTKCTQSVKIKLIPSFCTLPNEMFATWSVLSTPALALEDCSDLCACEDNYIFDTAALRVMAPNAKK